MLKHGWFTSPSPVRGGCLTLQSLNSQEGTPGTPFENPKGWRKGFAGASFSHKTETVLRLSLSCFVILSVEAFRGVQLPRKISGNLFQEQGHLYFPRVTAFKQIGKPCWLIGKAGLCWGLQGLSCRGMQQGVPSTVLQRQAGGPRH